VVTSVLEQPVVASAPSFVRELPTRWTAPAAIQPLGHDVRPESVGGVVRGLASTVAATTAAARESDGADLRWWRGRSARRRPAPDVNTAELSIPPADGEPSRPGDERSPEEPAGGYAGRAPARPGSAIAPELASGARPDPSPAGRTRPLATTPLPRTTPIVASRRPSAASATSAEPGSLPAPLGPPAELDPAAAVIRPDLPPTEVAAAIAAGAVPGQPVQVVRVNPGGSAADPTPASGATRPGPVPPGRLPPGPLPPGPLSPVAVPPGPVPPVAVPPAGRRRRTWLGAPLPPTANPADPATAPLPPPPTTRRIGPAAAVETPDQAAQGSTVDGPREPADATDRPPGPTQPASPVDDPAASSSGAISAESRETSRHSTAAPLDGPDDPPTAALSDPEPVRAQQRLDVVRPLAPDSNRPRDERSPEGPAGRYAMPRQLNPIVAPEPARTTPVVPNPAIGLRPITSRAAATTAPAVAAATALTMAGAAAVAPVRGLGESAASLYNEVQARIPGEATPEAAMESAGPALAGLPGAAAGPLARAAAALPGLPGSLPRLRPPAGLAGPAASLARAVPTRLPSPIELIAPGIASAAGRAGAIPGAGLAAAALSGAAGPIAASPSRAATASASGDDTPEPTDPAELDRLAGQLYGRIQRHLNADLLIGRERAQMLTDLG
jgi:hypothetical protein